MCIRDSHNGLSFCYWPNPVVLEKGHQTSYIVLRKAILLLVLLLLLQTLALIWTNIPDQLVYVANPPRRRSLHFACTSRLLVPSLKLSTISGWAFPVAGPTIWINLPLEWPQLRLCRPFVSIWNLFVLISFHDIILDSSYSSFLTLSPSKTDLHYLDHFKKFLPTVLARIVMQSAPSVHMFVLCLFLSTLSFELIDFWPSSFVCK